MGSAKPLPADDSDLGLARRSAAGDAMAFERIMRKNNRMMFRTARAILRDDAEAEDCVQSAYLAAYQALGKFAGESKLSTWLARIVINQAIERSRKIARQGVVVPINAAGDESAPIDYLESNDARPEEEAMRTELRTLIERRIDALPEAFRTVFVLRALEEMSVEETADLLHIPETTVRTRFFRARAMLRESLARDIDTSVSDAFAFDGERCDRLVAGVLARIRNLTQEP